MKKQVLISILFGILMCKTSIGQPVQEWVNTINGSIDSADGGSKVAMDATGNIYVTGFITTTTGNDFITVKYNVSGAQLWAATYNGPGNSDDVPRDLALDDTGNVYVTGLSFGNGTSEDFATVKYDANGVEQWVRRYNGPSGNTDFAAAMAISPAGYLHVTGRSRDNINGDDNITIKYDLAGNEIWINRYNYSVQNGHEKPADIIIDQNENIYVIGRSIGTSGLDDYLTIKLDSSGNVVWTKRYNGPSNDLDLATHIVLDNSGNPVITGYSNQSGQSFDIVTIKYDTSGNQLFLHRFNGGSGMDVPNGMVIDSIGNIYIAGYSYQGGATGSNFTTIKYNPSLNLQWSKFYDGTYTSFVDDNDRARSIALDGNGNIYITGSVNNSGSDHDITTIKYSSSGIQQWVQTYSGAGTGKDIGWTLAVNSTNEVYVVGESTEAGISTDFITIKYNQSLTVDDTNINPSFDINIYPNPTTGKFIFFLPSSKLETGLGAVEIYNAFAEKIYQNDDSVLSSHYSIDLSGWGQGVYYLKVKNRIKKIIVL